MVNMATYLLYEAHFCILFIYQIRLYTNKFCRTSVPVCQIMPADFGTRVVERNTFVQG